MLNVYRAVIESSNIFYHSMVWVDYTEGNAHIKQSCVNYFPNHRGDLPSLEILYLQCLLGRTTLISQDSSHLTHGLSVPLPSSRYIDSDPSKPGPTALVLAFPLSRSSPVKTEVIFSVHIFYHNLVYIILFIF